MRKNSPTPAVVVLTLSCSLFALADSKKAIFTREGGYWVEILEGKVPASASGRLKVKTRGPVVVRGDSPEGITYILRKKIQVKTEAEAQKLGRTYLVGARSTREATEIGVSFKDTGPLSAELEIHTPKACRGAVVETLAGNVEVYDVDGTLNVDSEGGNLQIDRIGGDTILRTGGGEIRLGQMNAGVRCKTGGGSIYVGRTGAESWLETAGGEIYIRETNGPVHASTAGGNIRVERAGGSVTAHTSGGRIDVQEARGYVTAANSGGSIQVGSAQGVRCESSGGTIKLRGTSGSLSAVTHVGSILAELIGGAPLLNSMLTTANGDITVYIPSNLALTVKAQSDGSRPTWIISDFPEIAVRVLNPSGPARATAEGTLNGGGPVLTITASGGAIYLRRTR
jgi:hypothetical protein